MSICVLFDSRRFRLLDLFLVAVFFVANVLIFANLTLFVIEKVAFLLVCVVAFVIIRRRLSFVITLRRLTYRNRSFRDRSFFLSKSLSLYLSPSVIEKSLNHLHLRSLLSAWASASQAPTDESLPTAKPASLQDKVECSVFAPARPKCG